MDRKLAQQFLWEVVLFDSYKKYNIIMMMVIK